MYVYKPMLVHVELPFVLNSPPAHRQNCDQTCDHRPSTAMHDALLSSAMEVAPSETHLCRQSTSWYRSHCSPFVIWGRPLRAKLTVVVSLAGRENQAERRRSTIARRPLSSASVVRCDLRFRADLITIPAMMSASLPSVRIETSLPVLRRTDRVWLRC